MDWLRDLRPCYTRQFFLQLVSQQTLRDKLQERFHTPDLQPATATKCWVASCKKSRNILYFWQRCETVAACDMSIATCQAILWKLGNQSPSFARRRFQAGGERVVNSFQWGHCKLRRNIANVWHPHCNLQCFSAVIVARQVARKIASCNMAFTNGEAARNEGASPSEEKINPSPFLPLICTIIHCRSRRVALRKEGRPLAVWGYTVEHTKQNIL